MKVVIVKKISGKQKQIIINQFPHSWQVVIVTPEELHKVIEDVDAIIPEHEIIDSSLLDKARNLKMVQTGAGYDNVMIEECSKRGIYVANATGLNSQAVAEHVFAFILCWYKNINYLNEIMKRGGYRANYIGSELSEKVIGIVGLGNIGREVARLATAFKMNVLGYHTRTIDIDIKMELVDFRTLLQLSDIVTLHVPLNGQTNHMIGQREFEIMKNDAFLINTSRGKVIDESSLIEALQAKKIGGAGLDVFEAEPLPEKSPLRRLRNVILTPHTAATPDLVHSRIKRFRFFAENIIRISQGKAPMNVLNQL